MTGESLPVKFRRGDVCKMGSTVTRGEAHGTVESTGPRTVFGRTAAMLQSVDSAGGSLQTLLLQMLLVAPAPTLPPPPPPGPPLLLPSSPPPLLYRSLSNLKISLRRSPAEPHASVAARPWPRHRPFESIERVYTRTPAYRESIKRVYTYIESTERE